MAASVLTKLRGLAPRDFEHLAYDLLVLAGLRNATWRTPGPDAGRDIEGECSSVDLSETLSVQRWYVECKHYVSAVDWPTIFSKLAYAANHGADFLLLVTTGNVSPRAKEEVARRAQRRESPAVRLWDAPVLENLVWRYPFLLEKYGLAAARVDPEKSAPLVALASKAVQSAHGYAVLRGSASPPLELGAALLDLLAARQTGWREGWSQFVRERDSYPWLSIATGLDVSKADAYGFRAIAAATRFYAGAKGLALQRDGTSGWSIRLPPNAISPTLRNALHMIALWTNLEIVVGPRSVRMVVRA